MDTTLLVFAAAVIGTIAGNLITARLAAAERKEARRKEYLEYLSSNLKTLIALRAKLQWVQHSTHGEERERETAYGEAFGIMLSMDHAEINRLAADVMEKQVPHEKLTAINYAIKELGKITAQVVRE